jgi:hypothetical protein
MLPPYRPSWQSGDAKVQFSVGAFITKTTQKRPLSAQAASGSSRMRLRADLASHSRAFCRNSAALLVGSSGEALEELFPGTLESFIKPTPCVEKSTLTIRLY